MPYQRVRSWRARRCGRTWIERLRRGWMLLAPMSCRRPSYKRLLSGDRNVLHQARAVPLSHHHAAGFAARAGDARSAGRLATVFYVARCSRCCWGDAPRHHRRRGHDPNAGDDHGLCRLLCIARRRAACRGCTCGVAQKGRVFWRWSSLTPVRLQPFARNLIVHRRRDQVLTRGSRSTKVCLQRV